MLLYLDIAYERWKSDGKMTTYAHLVEAIDPIVKTAIVLSAIPFSLVGSIWLLDLLDYNWSIAVWVGVIALAGLAAETGVILPSLFHRS